MSACEYNYMIETYHKLVYYYQKAPKIIF